ncbi:MAG: hypothetical protein GVX90_04000, partial [Alphaproteobacteria bacterium]|nr:hypothetical protein [Alphaproteobacteria bacterium]
MPTDEPTGIEDHFDPSNAPDDALEDPTTLAASGESPDGSLTDQLAALIDGTRTYAEAEFNFQKTRASLAGKNAGIALGLVVVAVVVLHVAVLA